ncbi:U-box domain [Carpediemonas membranifera]|uniref:U-box domain n=1 Tax=Carpediemonas membranifera TaxID=201153 RepID=A0A8J6AYX9_9EUKA|nr:U-box domain [Carpediemonas membranifera]|eukprot:KAG9390664.1 U-box domain [Carpediemonas membranifera]
MTGQPWASSEAILGRCKNASSAKQLRHMLSYPKHLSGHFPVVLERLSAGKRDIKAYIRYVGSLQQIEEQTAKALSNALQRTGKGIFSDVLEGPWKQEMARIAAMRDTALASADWYRDQQSTVKSFKETLKKRISESQTWYTGQISSLTTSCNGVETALRHLRDSNSRRTKAAQAYSKATGKKKESARQQLEAAHADAVTQYGEYTRAVGAARIAFASTQAAIRDKLTQLEATDRQRIAVMRESLRKLVQRAADTSRVGDIHVSRVYAELGSERLSDLDKEISETVRSILSNGDGPLVNMLSAMRLAPFETDERVDRIAESAGCEPPSITLAAPEPRLPSLRVPPAEFVCPIAHTVMTDPVVAADGQTYQRGAITEHLLNSVVSPVTMEKMGSKLLFANAALKKQIDDFLGFTQPPLTDIINTETGPDLADDGDESSSDSDHHSINFEARVVDSDDESTAPGTPSSPFHDIPMATIPPRAPSMSQAMPSPPDSTQLVRDALRDLDMLYPTEEAPPSPAPRSEVRFVRSSSAYSLGSPARSPSASSLTSPSARVWGDGSAKSPLGGQLAHSEEALVQHVEESDEDTSGLGNSFKLPM